MVDDAGRCVRCCYGVLHLAEHLQGVASGCSAHDVAQRPREEVGVPKDWATDSQRFCTSQCGASQSKARDPNKETGVNGSPHRLTFPSQRIPPSHRQVQCRNSVLPRLDTMAAGLMSLVMYTRTSFSLSTEAKRPDSGTGWKSMTR